MHPVAELEQLRRTVVLATSMPVDGALDTGVSVATAEILIEMDLSGSAARRPASPSRPGQRTSSAWSWTGWQGIWCLIGVEPMASGRYRSTPLTGSASGSTWIGRR